MGRDEWIQQTVERYEGPLVRYALRLTRDLDTARDVVQDVFLKLWQADRAQVEERLAAWLFMVCRNRALDVWRKENRMQYLEEDRWATAASPEPAPDQAVALKENVRVALELLAGLPEHQQEVVRLKFQSGLSYREIAEVTRLSETNVGFLIHTAIHALRRKMKGAGQTV